MGRSQATAPGAGRVHRRELDWLMLAVVGLCCLGLLMSVSVAGPRESVGPLAAMKAQGSKLLAGLVAFLCCAIVPVAALRRVALPAFAVATLVCATTRLYAEPVNHAYRWVQLGSYSFQPVELARFLLVIVVADQLARAGAKVRTLRAGFLPVMGAAGCLCGALVLQPDHGNALLVMALCACVGLVAGVRFLHFLPLAAAGVLLVVVQGLRHSYFVDRLVGFVAVRPDSQVGQGLLALASGGPLGRGLGQGWMKMGFVPEAQNDFVFAIVGEELGFVGSLLVLTLFSIIGWVGYRLVLTIRDPFLRFLVCGYVLLICMQAAVNLLVVTGWAPAKGIDLPFVSTGGTSLMFFLAAVGLVGNAARADGQSAARATVPAGRV